MAQYYDHDIDGDYLTSGPESGAFSSGTFDHEEIHKRIEELDERLSCAVCLSRFKDPRLLDCNHSFCRHCLVDILTKRLVHLDHPVGEDELVCPRCRKVTRLGHGGVETLPRNFDLEAVATALLPELETPVRPGPRLPQFTRQESMPICSEHKKELAYYCQTDGKLLCGDCLVEPDHKQHQTALADKVSESERDIFQKDTFELLERQHTNFSQAISDVVYTTSILKRKGEQTKERIQEHFQRLRDNMIQREEELLSATDKIILEKVKSLNTQEEQLNEIYKELDSELNHARRMLEYPPVLFLRERPSVVSKIQNIVKKAQQVDRSPVQNVSHGPYWHHPSLLLTGTEDTSGVFCDPTPSKFTAVGEGLKKAFIHVEASFKVEPRDEYGNKTFLMSAVPRIVIIGPGMSGFVPCTVEESVDGMYLARFTPKQVGFHSIKITVSEELILNGEHRVIVFNTKDYLGLFEPVKSIHRAQFQVEPTVSIMRGVCALSNGWIIFTDAFCLRVVDGKSGALIQTIGSYGIAPSQFNTPLGIAGNSQNNIFVTDSSNHRVQRFSLELNGKFRFSSLFGTQGQAKQCLQNPEGIAVYGDDKVFVVDRGNNRIQVLSQKSMKHSASLGKKGQRPGQFDVPRDVTVNTHFNCLLVSDTNNKRVQALTFDGKPLAVFGNYSYVCFELTPSYLAVDKDGFILITHTNFQVMTVLTPLGEYVRQICNLEGSASHVQFITPYGVCINNQGVVIVTDSTAACIHLF